MGIYHRPQTVEAALSAMAADDLTVIAGGTDFYPARVGRPLAENVLDLAAITELRGIDDGGDYWRIKALTTWSDLIAADLPACFDGLKLAAREVGGVQIQNAGTICGNICNASPAADGVPALLSLDAAVELAARDGVALVALGDFIVGNRKTTRRADQLVTAIRVPKAGNAGAKSHFLKLGARAYLVISIAMTAAVVGVDETGRVATAAVAVGACSPVAMRLGALERGLIGRRVDRTLGDFVAAEHIAPLAPIDDVRADATYRLHAARVLVRRMLNQLGAAP